MLRMRCSSVRWDCQPYSGEAAAQLARELGVSSTAATILVRRGHATPAAAERFLRADERHDPFSFTGIGGACELVLAHLARGSRIVVHGDYDVDGLTSTAVLVRALRRLGGDPRWHLPSRFEGGYGLSTATVVALARAGADLLITVDCGITSGPEIDVARARGMDVVVVDHHRPSERLPDCPIVHPTVSAYPFGELCAAGVALKLAEALDTTAGENPGRAEREDLDLVALATVADLVPLVGENRRLVRAGLRALARTDKPGLRALMAVASLAADALDAHAVGFRLGPRLNAAGRLGRADSALELVLTEDPRRAEEVAAELDLLNRERRAAEERILVAAEAARAEAPDAPALVLAGEGWSPGVIGIVASRMVERHGRPCVLVALDGDEGRGSGRSIPAYDLHAALSACAGHLRRYGGHRAAAGLEIDTTSLEAFRRDFLDHARASLTPEDLVPVETIDAVVPASALGAPLAEELERLGPFGQGNPRPTLLVPAARMRDVRGLGSEDEHAALTLTSGGARTRLVAFRSAPESLRGCLAQPHEVAARLELNEWNGVVEPRLVLRALCESEPGECEVIGEGNGALWDVVERERVPRLTVVAEGDRGERELLDRRGEGFAGTVGDLVSRGERVLVVCADVSRRRRAIEELLGGLGRSLRGAAADSERLALVAWSSLERGPGLARSFPNLVALDPPDVPEGERLLASAPGAGTARAYACWGRPEVALALRAAEWRLDLRPQLAAVYRCLRDHGRALLADPLERALRGNGPHARDPELCARLLRVLVELELVSYTGRVEGGPLCRVEHGRRTELERSPTYRASLARLEEARRYLTGPVLRPRLDATAESSPDHEAPRSPTPGLVLEEQPELAHAAA
jgi:single-stranded-DNA-specific exonuclease